MQPAVCQSRAPIASVGSSSTRFFCSRAALSRFSQSKNVDKRISIVDNYNNNCPTHQYHPHYKLKPLRVHCVADTRGADGVQSIQKTLDNLAKLCTNSNPVEKVIQHNGAVGSPKQNLGAKWREYLGSTNWEGMLDPLHENLRREIVKYGEFVQAAYSAFEFDPQSENYATCKYPQATLLEKVGLGGAGYHVTECIHTTSSIRVPKWLTDRFSGDWMAKQTSFMGFVAVCNDEKELFRIGRRDIVVAYRGTVTPLEWAENLKDVLISLTTKEDEKKVFPCCEPKVENGFWSLFTTQGPRGKSARNQVLDEVRRLVKQYNGEDISITITGHSLGAALSLLTAYSIAQEFNSEEHKIPVTVFSFGGPRVGNRAFGRRMEQLGAKVLRIVNKHDVITKVPGVVLNETWMETKTEQSKNLRKIARFLEKMPWAYCHVGRELVVNNKHSPYLKPDADMACCHDLEAYLHLVDGFLSSSIPFRSTAKRDLVRLLMNQKSNVLVKPKMRKEIRWQ